MRTDLAKEARFIGNIREGITEETEEYHRFEVTRIGIHSDEVAKAIDKPKGLYVTIQAEMDTFSDSIERKKLAECVSRELQKMIPKEASVMVIGLGNRHITADALGTKTAENIYATRHIQTHFRELLPNHTRTVTTFLSNVLGVTGMETVEVVSALGASICPDLILAVDSLSAQDLTHIGTVIQMNNSGICPGAGIGNHRIGLNEQTLHIPVVALGVPLVVSADAIVESVTKTPLDPNWKQKLSPWSVTPKDIDALVRDSARVLSRAINLALFGSNFADLERLLET